MAIKLKKIINRLEITTHETELRLIQGRMQDFSGGGGANFKISGIFYIHAAKRHIASSELLLGGLGACPPPQENF